MAAGLNTLLAMALVLPWLVPAMVLATAQAIVKQCVAYAGSGVRLLAATQRYSKHKSTSASTLADAAVPITMREKVHALAFSDAGDSPFTITCERFVSKVVPTAKLTLPILADPEASENQKTSAILTEYLRGSMQTFAWLPESLFLYWLTSDAAARKTFSSDHLTTKAFRPGDVVCGVLEVAYRAGAEGDASLSRDRVEMMGVRAREPPHELQRPSTELRIASPDPEARYRKAPSGVVLVAEVERTPAGVVFITETWMWRGPEYRELDIPDKVAEYATERVGRAGRTPVVFAETAYRIEPEEPDEYEMLAGASAFSPMTLESVTGRFLHGLLGALMMFSGIWRVTSKDAKSA